MKYDSLSHLSYHHHHHHHRQTLYGSRPPRWLPTLFMPLGCSSHAEGLSRMAEVMVCDFWQETLWLLIWSLWDHMLWEKPDANSWGHSIDPIVRSMPWKTGLPPTVSHVSEQSSKQVLQPESRLQIIAALAYILTGISWETKTEPPSDAMPKFLTYRTCGTSNVRCFKLFNFGAIAMKQITTILSDIDQGLHAVSYFAVTGGH